ncbi:MAG: PhoX family protein [Actinomycetales bacterium]
MVMQPITRTRLPMTGLTHSTRSAVTCHLRCGDACSQPAPNTSANPTFAEVAGSSLSRRTILGGALALTLVPALDQGSADAATLAGRRSSGRGMHRLRFTPIAPVPATVDNVTVPTGYTWKPIIRWGDPIFAGAPKFDPTNQSPQAQAQQFGYNNDYTDVIRTGRHSALLVCNHEYTNEGIMFPPDTDPEVVARTAWEAHGLSVVELRRSRHGSVWQYQRAGRRNRRITLTTEFTVDGPAAGSPLLQTAADPTGRTVRGTMNNCSGGTTPWGTVLSGEENIHQYFYAAGTSEREQRYGLGALDSRNWRAYDSRWDATDLGYVNEPNRFGYVIEVDPMNPGSTPVKHTAMGRIKHEGANVIVAKDGRVVAYMGDDERFEYVYKFVSHGTYDPTGTKAARRSNLTLLSSGDLYVARFTGDGFEDGINDGTGVWLPLTLNGASMVPGMSLEEVLVFTRLAADTVQPTKMDRPEDVQPSLQSRRIYVACTNNTKRTEAETDEVNPRAANKDGHIIEITEDEDDNTGRTFTWNLLLICGDPATAGTYFGGYTGPVSPISCPDNVAFDSVGNLWISTDGQPNSLEVNGTFVNDGLFKVPLVGSERGHVQQFLAVPTEAETCGPVIHDCDGSVFVAVQHPGEDGSWNDQHSYFPDFGRGGRGNWAGGPRPSVVQVVRD